MARRAPFIVRLKKILSALRPVRPGERGKSGPGRFSAPHKELGDTPGPRNEGPA